MTNEEMQVLMMKGLVAGLPEEAIAKHKQVKEDVKNYIRALLSEADTDEMKAAVVIAISLSMIEMEEEFK